MPRNRNLLVLASLFGGVTAGAADCPAPPVVTASVAKCFAESYVAKKPNADLPMNYQAIEKQNHWVVTYNPSDTNIRGGGGELRVEKATGKVTFVVGYR